MIAVHCWAFTSWWHDLSIDLARLWIRPCAKCWNAEVWPCNKPISKSFYSMLFFASLYIELCAPGFIAKNFCRCGQFNVHFGSVRYLFPSLSRSLTIYRRLRMVVFQSFCWEHGGLQCWHFWSFCSIFVLWLMQRLKSWGFFHTI